MGGKRPATSLHFQRLDPFPELCERRREGSVGLLRQQNAVGVIIALLSMWCVDNTLWQLWMRDAEIARDIEVVVFGNALKDVRQPGFALSPDKVVINDDSCSLGEGIADASLSNAKSNSF
jgi:hypothetical protein